MEVQVPAVRRMDELLESLWLARGSDLLISAGRPPGMRVDGRLDAVPGAGETSAADTASLLEELLSAKQLSAFESLDEYDFSFSWRDQARVRGNAFRQRGSIAISLRIIPYLIPSLQELHCPPAVTAFPELRQGLVLVTGPTGSGKSTTLASVINEINRTRYCHIITIEDPIEYHYQHERAMVNQREVGLDTASFASGLRAALREDPDVVLVGEIRDLESIRSALVIAETGHLVFATLHTNDTAQAIGRIIDVFPGEMQAQIRVQLAACLTGIVYQQLLPRIGGGMVAAHEVLMANPAVRNLIREGKTNQLRNTLMPGQREGMQTFEQSLSALVQAGQVTAADAMARSLHPKDIQIRQLNQQKVSA